jgi:hypothetical protein
MMSNKRQPNAQEKQQRKNSIGQVQEQLSDQSTSAKLVNEMAKDQAGAIASVQREETE